MIGISNIKTPKKSKIINIEDRQKIKPHRIDFTIFIVTMVLIILGLLMLFSTSYYDSYRKTGESFSEITNQLKFFAIGLVAMIAFTQIDYIIWKKTTNLIYIISVVLLAYPLLAYPEKFRRWIYIGSPESPIFSFQPSEIGKFAVILICAKLIDEYGEEYMKIFKYGVLRVGMAPAVIAVLIIAASHTSGFIIVVAIVAVMMFTGGTRLRHFFLVAAIVIPIGYFLIMHTEFFGYAKDRIFLWLGLATETETSDNYQMMQSLYAISSGGVSGLGLGGSRQKFGYVPERDNDYIFAIVCEELGFFGGSIIILLYLVLALRGYFIAFRARDIYGKMIAIGISTQIILQAFFNIAVATGVGPPTGISLPFFSSGGTSLMILMGQMGILFSVSKTADFSKKNKTKEKTG